jgi:hypothetical protein
MRTQSIRGSSTTKKFPGNTWKRDFKSVFICGFIFPIKDFQLKKYPTLEAAQLCISVNLK